MVLADRGFVCIDEFDKMNEIDRVSIHEVMEQQTVTISKAGMHVSLNARCSVVAAANPIFGDYDRSLPAAKNIGLPDSLLSRFDLIFVVLDEKNPVSDALVAQKVINNHRSMLEGANSSSRFTDIDTVIQSKIEEDENQKQKPVFREEDKLLTKEFLKKYIHYSRKTFKPLLTDAALEFVKESYAMLRQRGQESDSNKKMPITARTLETLIRLGTAHAKMRHSKKVEVSDLQEGLKLLSFSIFEMDIEAENNDDMEPFMKRESAMKEEQKYSSKRLKTHDADYSPEKRVKEESKIIQDDLAQEESSRNLKIALNEGKEIKEEEDPYFKSKQQFLY